VKWLPVLTAGRLVKTLERAGFHVDHQKGSHVVPKNESGRIVVVPKHKGDTIDRQLLSWILSEAGISHDDFLDL
jgi:predicted RNA binding protein YcfA (HicA-like mRNA interferase family)